jgi:hypothetical protein
MSDRRVPPGGGIVIGLALGLLMWACITVLAKAQEPMTRDTSRQWFISLDTLGISPVPGTEGQGIYTTWVFAQETPTSFPSSAILVAWDCPNKLVRRFEQIKYEMDSTGVIRGATRDVNMPWVAVVDPRMFSLVCTVGPQHEAAMREGEDDSLPPPPSPDKPWDGKSSDA